MARRRGLLQARVVSFEGANRPGHVRLAGTEPHLPHEDILDLDRVGSLHGEGESLGNGQGIEPQFPLPIGSRRGRLCLSRDRDRDLLSRRRRPPDWDGNVALEDHVAGEHGRKYDLGWGDRR